MTERYRPGRFRDCRFCHGRGCAACDSEAERAYKLAFPDGPKPLATFNTDDPADVERLKATCGMDALTKAFGPGGGGIDEIEENLKTYGERADG